MSSSSHELHTTIIASSRPISPQLSSNPRNHPPFRTYPRVYTRHNYGRQKDRAVGYLLGWVCKHLSGDQRLVLRSQSAGCLLDGRWRFELLLRRSREIFTLVSGAVLLHVGLCWLGRGHGRRGATTRVSDHLLSLGRVVSNILLCDIGGTSSVVAGELLDLRGLLVDNAGGIVDVAVDEFLVGLVDERGKEEDGGGDESKAPQWDDLDQVVGGEGTEEGLVMVSVFHRTPDDEELTATDAKTFSAKTIR